jgi:hypothetical protein
MIRSTSFVRTLALALVAGLLLVGRTAGALCAPSAEGIFPASGIVGTVVNATVPGMGLTGATASVIGSPGLDVVVQNATDLDASLQLTIDAAALPGERIVTLTTAAGAVNLSFTVNPAGGPIVATVSPPPIVTQGFPIVLSITGENLASLDLTQVSVTGTGLAVTAVTPAVDGLSADISLDVAADASLGTQALVIATPLGGAVLQLAVVRPAPVVTGIAPGAGEIGATVPITLTGSGLTGAALVITSGAGGAGGVTITDVATPDDATLTATLTIAGSLVPETEPRLLIVTSEAGQTTAEFFIVAPNVPSLTTIRPGAGEPGDTVPIELKGLNLTGATLSTLLPLPLTLQNVAVVDDETITAEVVIDALALANTNHQIIATVGLDSSSITFRVIPVGLPFIGRVRPPFGNRGATLALFLDGVNLGTTVLGTGVDLSGPKITESNALPLDEFTVRAILDIDDTASVGFRDVTCTTAAGFFTKSAAFRVNVPGQVPIITSVTPNTVDPGTTTPITVTGSGFEGGGVLVTGPGATVANVVIDPTGTIITFDLTLAADAPADSRQLIVVTENGIATCGILTSVAGPELLVATLLKTGSVFEVTSAGFRLVVFEFSINENFETGLRTYAVSSATTALTLNQLQAENVGRAVRDLPFVYVRASGITATNQTGTSDPYRIRRWTP